MVRARAPSNRVDARGQKFGRLTAVRMLPKREKNGCVRWLCVCACGNRTAVSGTELRSGGTRSCGCLRTEQLVARSRTHGLSRHHLYRTWDNMKRRCEDPSDKEFRNYGGRGIRVCLQWRRSFASFVQYIMNSIGPRPRGKSLDRTDNNRGYEPGNLRWATPRQQTLNQRPRRTFLPRGIYVVPSGYRAAIKVGGRLRHLGIRRTLDAAVAIRQRAERRYRFGYEPARARRRIHTPPPVFVSLYGEVMRHG
jgi:hypothetical protein